MLQIVGALILLIAGFAILRLLFRALTSTASALAGFILLCLFGPALLAGYITERITRLPLVVAAMYTSPFIPLSSNYFHESKHEHSTCYNFSGGEALSVARCSLANVTYSFA